MHRTFGVSVSETMAARGLVNGRGPCSRRCSGRWELVHIFRGGLLWCGRDSAKRVVSDTDTQKFSWRKGTDRTVPFVSLLGRCFFRSLGLAEVVFAVFDQEVVPACYFLDVAGIYAVAVKIGHDTGKEIYELGI